MNFHKASVSSQLPMKPSAFVCPSPDRISDQVSACGIGLILNFHTAHGHLRRNHRHRLHSNLYLYIPKIYGDLLISCLLSYTHLCQTRIFTMLHFYSSHTGLLLCTVYYHAPTSRLDLDSTKKKDYLSIVFLL